MKAVYAGGAAGFAALVAAAVWLALPGTSTVYVAASGDDGNACTQSAPCRSFDRAASAGDTVHVAAGAYPQQDVKHAADFVADGLVTVGCGTVSTVGGGTIGGQSCIDVYVSNVSFDGGSNKWFTTAWFTANGFRYQGRIDTERGTTNISFTNIDVGAVAAGSADTHVTYSDLGPSVDPLNNRCCGTSMTWEHNLIHDYRIKNGGHMECVTWDGGHADFLYNTFRGCDVFAIFAKPVDDISGRVEFNTFAPDSGTNNDLKVCGGVNPSCVGSGAKRCDVNVFGNSFSNSTYIECPGVTFNDPGGPPPPTTTVPPRSCVSEQTYRQTLAALRAGTLYKSYAKANPKEYGRVNPWLDAPTATAPAVNTATGRALVGFGTLYVEGC